jgi:hypothetical protein
MNPSWSPRQREALEAMGLPVYRLAGATAPVGVSEAPPGAAPPATAATLDPLTLALLRAAGLGRDAVPLARDWPPLQDLRRDPQAKRALWPRLRALRRSPA